MIATIDTFARTIVGAFATGVLTSAILAAFVAILVLMVRPSATTRHALWWIVLAATVALPIASTTVSFGRIEHRANSGISSAYRTPIEARNVVPAVAPELSSSSGIARSDASDTTQPHIDWSAVLLTALRQTLDFPGLATLLVALWIAVASLRTTVTGYGFVALMRMKATASELDESIARRLRRFRHSSRMGRPTALLVSDDIDVPVAVGFRKPAILLPAHVARRDEIADLDQIVMHEHAHLNRYDDVTNLLQVVLEGLFWFNPVIAFVGRQISLQREIACDDSVIAQTGRAYRYATCLWRLVESARLPTQGVMAPGALFTPKQITTRIERLLDSKRNALPRLSPVSAFALATLCAVVIVAQALRAPVIALEDQPSAPAAVASRAVAEPLAVPSPAPPKERPSSRDDARRDTEVRIGSGATPEAIANAVIDATMKRSFAEARRTSTLQSSEIARAAAALGTGIGLDVARQLSEKLAPASEWPAIERSIASAEKHAQHEIARANLYAAAASASTANHRNLDSFRTVRVEGSFDVEIRRGARPSIDFQGDANVADHTKTGVSDDALTIDQIDGTYDNEHPKTILVTVPEIDRVEVNGSADVRVVNARTSHFSASIAGSGNLVASGAANAADVTIEGSGNVDLASFSAASIDVKTEGSGNVTLVAPTTLSVRIDGSGDVKMSGTPKHLSTSINGSGSIVRL